MGASEVCLSRGGVVFKSESEGMTAENSSCAFEGLLSPIKSTDRPSLEGVARGDARLGVLALTGDGRLNSELVDWAGWNPLGSDRFGEVEMGFGAITDFGLVVVGLRCSDEG